MTEEPFFVKISFKRFSESADQLNPDEVGTSQDDHQSDIPFLHFTDATQEVFDTWRASLEKKVRSGEEHPAIESHLAKYRSLIPSLALIIHLADGECGNIGVQAVSYTHLTLPTTPYV